jgi:hypothetical protein
MDILSKIFSAFRQIGTGLFAVMTNDVSMASNKLAISAESVSFSAGAAGTTGVVTLDKAPVYDNSGARVGSFGDTSFSWVTGTILTTEVRLNLVEYQTDTEFLATLSNGQFAIDYVLGKIYYCKATNGTSDTCNYTTRQLNVEVTAAGVGADVNVKQVGGTTIVADHAAAGASPKALPVSGVYRLAADTYDDGDAVVPHFTAAGKLMVDASMAATDYADDSAFQIATDKVMASGFLADETATDSVDEGDIGLARMTLERKLHIASTEAHDAAASAYANMVGFEAKTFDGAALPNPVGAEADIVRAAASLSGVQYVMPVNQDGSKSPIQAEDTAHTSGDVGYVVLAVQKSVNAAIADDGDYTPIQLSQHGYVKTTVNAIRDAAVAVGSGAADSGTQRVMLATDDPLVAKTPALGTALMAASAPITVATNDTQFGAVGAAADADGNIHGQLYYLANQLDALVSAVDGDVAVTNATGNAAIATTTAVAAKWKLNHITVHFSAAPTTSEDLTITLDANDGAPYDTVLLKQDPSASSATDIVYKPIGDLVLEAGDEIAVAFTNTDGRTYGLRIVGQLI